ncbi:MAG: hypothetical protein IPP04_10300 [Saprospiraceae bacterium]|nr:hypothetical protein [Saprospiraceae bacterium]
MIESLRNWYNASFNDQKYAAYLKAVSDSLGESAQFHLAETPVFIPKAFRVKLLQACEDLIDTIVAPQFLNTSEKAILPDLRFANDPGYCPTLIFDFGICQDDQGVINPQLIEMQGFPSLYCFQVIEADAYRQAFDIPMEYDNFVNISKEEYISLLKKTFVGDTPVEEVVLMDYQPESQKTRIDFAATKKLLGIDAVCITRVMQDGRQLYYEKNGIKQKISKIYNRLIFDEFYSMNIPHVDMRQDLDVTWIPHPNWFCRISKHTLPYIKSDFVPETTFVSDLKNIPDDLSQYVLKPVYSYAGMGVVIDVTQKDIENIKDPNEWILQKKVHYHPIIKTPDVPAKCEIRMMAIWESPDKRPRVVHNLARLSKGKMIGVRYNADFKWVGSSSCFFES